MGDLSAIREEKRLIRQQQVLARSTWLKARTRLVEKSGPGYLRYTDPAALRIVEYVTADCLAAGCSWRDIENGIERAAQDAMATPRRIFDFALASQSAREVEHQARVKASEASMDPEVLKRLPRMRRMP